MTSKKLIYVKQEFKKNKFKNAAASPLLALWQIEEHKVECFINFTRHLERAGLRTQFFIHILCYLRFPDTLHVISV
jgi:hypothetical protein